MKSKSSKDEEKIETVKEDEPTVLTPKEEIQKLKSEVEDYNEKFLRIVADFDNFRKRIDRDREQQSLRLRGEILSNFLEIVDTVEKAVEVDHPNLERMLEMQGDWTMGLITSRYNPVGNQVSENTLHQ